MSLNKKIAQNTIAQVSGKALSTLLGLVAVAIMTRSLGLLQFGWYATAVGFLQFVGILCDFGFTLTTATMLSEPRFNKDRVLNTLFTWRLITALICYGLAPIIFLLFPYPTPVKLAVFITSVSFLCMSMIQVLTGYFQVQLKTQFLAAGELLSRITLVAGFAICAYYTAGFLPVMGIISLAALSSTIFLLKKTPPLKLLLDKEISRAAFVKLWPTALTVIFNAIYLQGDRVILPLYVAQTEVGLYGAAYRVIDIVIQTAAIVMGIIMPLITFAWSRNLLDDFKKFWQKGMELTALLLFPMMAGIMALSDKIMLFVAGKEFSGSGPILFYLSFAIFGITFGLAFGYVALSIGRQKQAVLIYASNALLSTIGYFLFIPRYGIYGAAGVTIFSELYAAIGLGLLTYQYTKVMPSFKNIIKIIFASVAMALFIIYLPLPHVILSVIAGVAIYIALILLLQILHYAEIKEIFKKSKGVV